MLLEIGNFNHKSIFHVFVCFPKNITRGSTDPEVGHQMTPLTLVANLATRQRHLHWFQFWPPDGATCISCKFGHQMAPLALVANLATRWRHLHQFQIWPPDGATCIGCKFGQQMAPFESCQDAFPQPFLVYIWFWSPDGATCISCKFGHQMAPLVCWFIWSSVGHQVA